MPPSYPAVRLFEPFPLIRSLKAAVLLRPSVMSLKPIENGRWPFAAPQGGPGESQATPTKQKTPAHGPVAPWLTAFQP